MAKKKPHQAMQKSGPPQPAPVTNPAKMPSFMAALFNGAKVMEQPVPEALGTVDAHFLDELSGALAPDKAAKFTAWLERFSSFCKDLEKKSETLTKDRTAWLTELDTDKQALELQRSEADKQRELATTKLEQEREQLRLQRERLTAEQQALQEREATFMPRLEALTTKQATLQELELSLIARELDANRGFVGLKQQMLDGLKTDIRTLEASREELLKAIELHKGSLSQAQQDREAELDQRDQTLQEQRTKLERDQARLQRQSNVLEQERRLAREEMDRALKEKDEQHRKEVERLEVRLTRLTQYLDTVQGQADGLKALHDAFGDRDPQTLLDEFHALQRQNEALRSNGVAADAERLALENQGIREQLSILQSRIRELTQDHEQAKAELSRKRLGALELETLSMEKRGLEKHKQLLGAALVDLEARVDSLTAASKTQSPFPQLTVMDEHPDFRTKVAVEPVPQDLTAFATELQQRIAVAERGTKLYYRIDDIRALLGGLAMSQLHVFQGISGTGKTSLAKAFAKAMGGSCTDIAVQAGWRDRDDLLGHYNAFEKRFYEKDCLQALYKAQTDAWEDRCNVILLDEMNLSRPEQYFAEFLSALEKNNPSERLITLSEHAVAQAPSLLKEQRKILVPNNVWFIGTANHDETTSELADKTYDRAHVMTLPRHEESFETARMDTVHYSYSSLQERFKTAEKRHANEVGELLAQLKRDALTPLLEEQFQLGWGNRFERQAKRFIPVMMACGATKQDALDHLLSTRVMRAGKVTKRYDITLDTLTALENAFDKFCTAIGADAPKSRELIKEDRRHKEQMA